MRDCGERELARAEVWLWRQKMTAPESTKELLAVRLAGRARGRWLEYTLLGVAVLLKTGWGIWGETHPRPSGLELGLRSGALLALVLGCAGNLLIRRRALCRASAALARPVAGPARVSLEMVVSPTNLITAAATYGGALIIAAVMALFTTALPDRVLAAMFIAGVLVLAVIAVLALMDAIRRPALATDAGSLALDDLFRAMDAYRALAPYPVLVGVMITPERVNSEFGLLLIGYAIAVVIGYALSTRHATKVEARTRMTLQSGMISQ